MNATGAALQALQKIQSGSAIETTQLAAAFSALTPAQIANLAATNNLSESQLKAALRTSSLTLEQKKEVWSHYNAVSAKGADKVATDSLSWSMKNLAVATLESAKAFLKWMVNNPLGQLMLVTAGIIAAVAIYKKLNVTIEEHIEKIKELNDEYESNQNSIESLESELESTQQRIVSV